jgi:hypothetical protein
VNAIRGPNEYVLGLSIEVVEIGLGLVQFAATGRLAITGK